VAKQQSILIQLEQGSVRRGARAAKEISSVLPHNWNTALVEEGRHHG
jgi:hypothetical protein